MLRPIGLLATVLLMLAGCRSTGRDLGFRSPGPRPPATIQLVAVGDILLDRGVAKQIERRGVSYPFGKVAGILSAADIAFGNLECPLSARGTKVLKRYCFKARPTAVACLLHGGLDLLSLANNHTMDCGRTGLMETMATLEQKGLHWCGAGRTRAEAEQATVLEARGLKIAFVGFCDFLPEGSFLRDDRPTIALASEEGVRRAVAAARSQADVVVVSFHWGVEYESYPTPRQQRLARAAVEAGADLVLGHHPHVLQGLEVVPRRSSPGRLPALIVYSLGNFVFDRRTGLAAQSAILRCTLTRRGVVDAELLPVRIDGLRPCPAREPDASEILTRLARLSASRHTRVTAGRVALTDRESASADFFGALRQQPTAHR